MQEFEDNIIVLDDIEIKILKDIVSQFSYNPSEEPDLFCQEAKELSNLLPENIKQRLLDFSKNGNKKGFLLFKNAPLDEFGNTPETNHLYVGEQTLLAKIQSLFLSFMGHIIAYEAEGKGHLVQDIVPVKNMENNQTSVGSTIELEVHTEQAFSRLKPDLLSLGCLRGDPNAFTYILPVGRIVEQLDSEEIELLFQPLWKTKVDLSFKLNGHEFIDGDVRGPLSILNGSCFDPTLVFDQDLMFGTTEFAQHMITKIVDIYYNRRIKYNLQPGDIMLVDNNRAIHGRSPFFPKYDGNDRFIVRSFGTFDYKKSSYARPKGKRYVGAIYS
jgi:L-asparagine oxygenase